MPCGPFWTRLRPRTSRPWLGCVTDNVSYENVPHGAVHGKAGLRSMLGPFLVRCERVRWDIITAAVGGDLAFVERVDRFWIDADEYSIECCGIYRVRNGLIASVRDYVDLGLWRERLGSVRDPA
jgi:limonene-1,2-epoxide hydrolase